MAHCWCNILGLHTLSQVEDGPGHLQPLVPVRHLQRIQEPHHIRPLLLRRQLNPPLPPSCRTQQHKAQVLFSEIFVLWRRLPVCCVFLALLKDEMVWCYERETLNWATTVWGIKLKIKLLFSCEAKLKLMAVIILSLQYYHTFALTACTFHISCTCQFSLLFT